MNTNSSQFEFEPAKEPLRVREAAEPDGTRLAASRTLAEHLEEIARLKNEIAKLEAENFKLQKDALTDLPSRTALSPVIGTLLGIAKRRPDFNLSLILLDADYFKGVNDTYGHEVGDQILRHIADTLKATLRTDGDFLGVGRKRRRDLEEWESPADGKRVAQQAGRWGGEEFIVLLPGSNLLDAERVAERIRAAVAAPIETILSQVRPLPGKPKRERPISVSLGVAAFQPGDDAAALLKRADTALYRAKENGRNQVVSSKPEAKAAREGGVPCRPNAPTIRRGLIHPLRGFPFIEQATILLSHLFVLSATASHFIAALWFAC